MGNEFAESLFINLPRINEKWVAAHEVQFHCGGVSEFRVQKLSNWSSELEARYNEYREQSPVKWSAVSDMCDDLAAGRVASIVSFHFQEAGLWGRLINTSAYIRSYNQTVTDCFQSIADVIAREWASHFSIEI